MLPDAGMAADRPRNSAPYRPDTSVTGAPSTYHLQHRRVTLLYHAQHHQHDGLLDLAPARELHERVRPRERDVQLLQCQVGTADAADPTRRIHRRIRAADEERDDHVRKYHNVP